MIQLQRESPLTPPLLDVVILHIVKDESLEIAHLTSRKLRKCFSFRGKPPDPPPLLGVVILYIGMMEVLKLLI